MKKNILTFILSGLALSASAQEQKAVSGDVMPLVNITTQQSGIPALLNDTARSSAFSDSGGNMNLAVKSRQDNIQIRTLLKNIREQQTELGAQKKQIAKLEAELKMQQDRNAAKNDESSKQLVAKDGDLKGAQQLVTLLQKQLMDKTTALDVARNELKQQKAQQQRRQDEALISKQSQLDELQRQLAQTGKALTDKSQALVSLQQRLDEQKRAVGQNGEALKAKDKVIADLTLALQEKRKALDEAQQEKARQQPKPLSDNLQNQQSYAVGVSLGLDMKKLLDERASQGVTLDTPWVLVGVTDSFSGQYKLDESVRNKLLFDGAVMVSRSLKKSKEKALNEGKNQLIAFRKSGAQKMENGCWYKIDYPGKGAIRASDKVSVVMKESLANGKVISDMEASGNVVTQQMKDYPPVFSAAIGKLQNHGSMVLMVPPELAYGDKGLPPAIPPGSTMVYTLRIVDVSP